MRLWYISSFSILQFTARSTTYIRHPHHHPLPDAVWNMESGKKSIFIFVNLKNCRLASCNDPDIVKWSVHFVIYLFVVVVLQLRCQPLVYRVLHQNESLSSNPTSDRFMTSFWRYLAHNRTLNSARCESNFILFSFLSIICSAQEYSL